MKNHIRLTLAATFSVLGAACATPAVPEPPQSTPSEHPERQLDVDYLPAVTPFEVDDERPYYTRVNLWYERGKHSTTNYARGTLIPVNTKVKIRPLRRTSGTREAKKRLTQLSIYLTDKKARISIHNMKTYSQVSLDEFFFRSLSMQPVDLSVFDETMRDAIAVGEPLVGMTKYQVLLTRGYPPGHRTPDLSGDRWYYWDAKFSHHAVVFSDGKVVDFSSR